MTDPHPTALRTVFVTAAAVLAVVGAFIGIDLAFAVALALVGWWIDMPFVTEIGLLWLIMAFWVLPKDWRSVRRGYSCRGSVVINASVEEVWDAVCPAARSRDYRATIDHISSDAKFENRFHLHFDRRLGTGDHRPVPVDITRNEPLRYLRLDYPDADAMPGGAADLGHSEIILHPTVNGVHVTLQDTLRRLSVMSIVSLVCFNPCQDAADRLKAYLEGADDSSRLGRLMDGMSADGAPDPSIRNGAIVAGVTAFVVLSAIGVGIGAYLAWSIPML